MTSTNALNRLFYVYAVSDFTLPALESCLRVRPSELLMIISSTDKFRGAAERLKAVLQDKLPGLHIDFLGERETGAALEGDDIIANAEWLREHLLPRLVDARGRGLQCAANITGGTKAMTLTLATCFDWDRLDYQPINQAMLSVRLCRAEPPNRGDDTGALLQFIDDRHAVPESITAPSVSPMDVARLHNLAVNPKKLNPMRKHAQALDVARAIWRSQHDADPALSALFAGFERVWVTEREQHQEASPHLSWQDFYPPGRVLESSVQRGVEDWVRYLQTMLDGPEPLLRYDASGITVPGNAPKGVAQHWRQWISGDWLEQLAHQWLLDDGIPADAIACSLRAGPEGNSGDGQREADLLVHHQAHHRARTTLIEVKAGQPPGRHPRELEEQLSSIGERFGRTEKALLLGPKLLQDLTKQNRYEAFELRCRANNVKILVSQQDLLDCVRGKRSR